MVVVLEGILILALGILGIGDGIRLTLKMRPQMNYDLVGPDHYLIMTGLSLAVLGLAYLVYTKGFEKKEGGTTGGLSTDDFQGKKRLCSIFLAMVLYVVLIQIIGYLLATIIYLLATFRIMGVNSWRTNACFSIAAGVAFQLIFVRFANMALPQGFWGIGL